MDISEEQNSDHTEEPQVPEETAPNNPTQSAVADQDSGAKSGKKKSKNNDSKPDAMPDDPAQLKSLVQERDRTIVDLRERNRDLQHKLNEKEKVVTALTSRLEQAAEQLDRLHRSGADRGGKILSGIPADVIEEQRELINDLKSALQQWEDLQSTSAMGRFEAQIRELREMLAEQLELKDRIDKGGRSTSPFKSTPSAPTSTRSSWDEMKAQLLGDSSGSSAKAKSDILIPGAEKEAEPETSDGRARYEEEYESEFVIDIPERPAPVEDIDQVDTDTLKAAIKERDEHIDRLMEVIDTLKEISGQDEFQEAKTRQKELEDRMAKADAEMKEKLRQAEVEMSMERAKLAREAARLQQMGADPDQPAALETNGAEDKEQAGSEDKGSRWARFLGSR